MRGRIPLDDWDNNASKQEAAEDWAMWLMRDPGNGRLRRCDHADVFERETATVSIDRRD